MGRRAVNIAVTGVGRLGSAFLRIPFHGPDGGLIIAPPTGV